MQIVAEEKVREDLDSEAEGPKTMLRSTGE